MIRQNRDLGQDADTEAGGDSGLNADEVGAGIGDVPGTTRGLERMDRPVAVEASLLEHGERQRLAAEIDGVTATGDPVQALGPGGDTPALAQVALEQPKVELTALERVAQIDAQSAAHVEA